MLKLCGLGVVSAEERRAGGLIQKSREMWLFSSLSRRSRGTCGPLETEKWEGRQKAGFGFMNVRAALSCVDSFLH